jgi:Glycosyl transferase family 2
MSKYEVAESPSCVGRHPVQVVIPSVRPDLVSGVVRAVRQQGLGDGLVVVDDTLDGTVSRAIEGDSQPTLLRTNGVGSGAARNAAMQLLTAPWILFLDDDICLPEHFGEQVLRAIKAATKEVAIIECPVIPIGRATSPYWRCRVVETSQPGGFLTACLLVRREPFIASGGMVSSFRRPFREDTDLGLRILALGHKSEWRTEFCVQHPLERMSLRRYLQTARLFRYDANFNRRHPGYLNRTGREIRIGRVSLRGFRRRLPLIALGSSALLLGVGGTWWMLAIVPWVGAGLGLHTLHLRSLQRAGFKPRWRALMRLDEVVVHGMWAVVAALARCQGEIELIISPIGSLRDRDRRV